MVDSDWAVSTRTRCSTPGWGEFSLKTLERDTNNDTTVCSRSRSKSNHKGRLECTYAQKMLDGTRG